MNSTRPTLIQTWCRKPTDSRCYNEATCITPCTDAQVRNNGYVRMPLRVKPNSHPNCRKQQYWNGYVLLMCNMRPTGFGQSKPYVQGGETCKPWSNLALYNRETGRHVEVAYLKHWSWKKSDEKVYFAVYEKDANRAQNLVNGVFDNRGRSSNLYIDIRSTGQLTSIPDGYDAGALNTFTYVYGRGSEYGGRSVDGKIRRRL